MGLKWDIEKFTGDNNFGLWKVKMEAVLIQQKCGEALKGEGLLLVTSAIVFSPASRRRKRFRIIL